MNKTIGNITWLGLIKAVILCIVLFLVPNSVQAQEEIWPPFNFKLTPSYQTGKITFQMTLNSQVEWQMTDVVVKIPLPQGTRFLEATANPATSTDFDGQEITFFTAILSKPLRDAIFVVEITDPSSTIFTIQPWVAWQGEIPGDYLAEPLSVDTSRTYLDWERPARPRLQLGLDASLTNDIITYTLYPKVDSWQRMWDLKINLPLPEGTKFLSANAPAPFTVDYDGREVSFSVIELEQDKEIKPLSFQVSIDNSPPLFISTYAWASWRNVLPRRNRRGIPAQEQLITSELVVSPNRLQRTVIDTPNDVPFPDYDINSLTIGQSATTLTINFHTAKQVDPASNLLRYRLLIDSDCNLETGRQIRNGGIEHQISYNLTKDRATIVNWDDEQEMWISPPSNRLLGTVNQNIVTIAVPRDFFSQIKDFCWIAQTSTGTEAFFPNPPSDWLPDNEAMELNQYELTIPFEPSPEGFLVEAQPSVAKTSAETSYPDVNGKLAIPLQDKQGLYNVHIFSLPNAQEIDIISRVHQPNFRFDGQTLLLNQSDVTKDTPDIKFGTQQVVVKYRTPVENFLEYNVVDRTRKPVLGTVYNTHPFYSPQGDQVVYGHSDLAIRGTATQLPHIFLQCNLLPSQQKSTPQCWGPLDSIVYPEQSGQVIDSYPVWASSNSIIYRGCDRSAETIDCGIFIVDPGTNGDFGFKQPRQLTQEVTDIPADSKGNIITFMSNRDRNWEVYSMNLDGSQLRNLSNSPNSNDGLPTISPDGNWVAFVSNRSGIWAVWVVSVIDRRAEKLFDLPVQSPWGIDNHDWLNERISWAP